jgi:hypothetical protein
VSFLIIWYLFITTWMRSIKYTISFVFLETICSYTECNRLAPVHPRKYMYSSIFTSTRSNKDGHKMIFPWMCQSKAFVFSESDERGLPCVGLQAGVRTEMHDGQFRRKLTSGTEMAEVTASLN